MQRRVIHMSRERGAPKCPREASGDCGELKHSTKPGEDHLQSILKVISG